jgi:hypothetical protein
MKAFKINIVFVLIILTSLGCDTNSNIIGEDEGRKIVGKGDIITQTVSLPSFSSISNTIPANINVTVGSPQKIVFKAQQNVLDEMVLEIKDFELRLNFEEDVTGTASNGIEVDITVPEFYSITSTGVGTLFLSGPKQNEMSINVSGVVNVKAYDLEVDICSVSIAGLANCKVKVNNTLSAVLSGIGNVYYRGNPTINATTSGIGKVINDN